MKQITFISFFIMCSVMFIGFQEDPLDIRIQEGIQIKIKKLKKEKRLDCKQIAIQKADAYIDSLVAVEVTQSRLENSGIPIRPYRPDSDARDSMKGLDLDLVPVLPRKGSNEN